MDCKKRSKTNKKEGSPRYSCSEKTTRPQKNKHISIVLIAVFLFALISIGVLFFAQQNQNNTEKSIIKSLDALIVTQKHNRPDDIGSQIANDVLSNTSYKITSVQAETATVSITAPDIYTLYKQALADIGNCVPASIEEYESLTKRVLTTVQNDLKNQNYTLTTTDILVQYDNNGNIEITRELIDACYGGVLTLQEDLVNEYIGGENNEEA